MSHIPKFLPFLLLMICFSLTGCSSLKSNGRSPSPAPNVVPDSLTPSREYEEDSDSLLPLPAPAADLDDDSFSFWRWKPASQAEPTRKQMLSKQQPRRALFANGIPRPQWRWPESLKSPLFERSSMQGNNVVASSRTETPVPPPPADSVEGKLRRYRLPLSGGQLLAEKKKIYKEEDYLQPITLSYEPLPESRLPQSTVSHSQMIARNSSSRSSNRPMNRRSGPDDWNEADWLMPTNLDDWQQNRPAQAGPSRSIIPVMSVPQHVSSHDMEKWPHHVERVAPSQPPATDVSRPQFEEEQPSNPLLVVP